MKKLLIMAAAAMTAGLLQAATVNWASGALCGATSADGGWGTTTVKNSLKTGTELAVSVYMVDSDAFAAASALLQQDLYAQYKGETATYTASTAAAGNVTAVQTGAEVGEDYYAVVIYTYTDAAYPDYEMYMATTASIAGTDITNDLNTYTVDSIGSTVGSWQAVPEPTSGLLLLVGGALLALKRKRA